MCVDAASLEVSPLTHHHLIVYLTENNHIFLTVPLNHKKQIRITGYETIYI